MANTETTMLYCIYISMRSSCWGCLKRREVADHDHACITPTTGFILAVWRRDLRRGSDAALALGNCLMNEGMSW
jgi:hypothetical protein